LQLFANSHERQGKRDQKLSRLGIRCGAWSFETLLAPRSRYNTGVLVSVTINSLNSGRIQICVRKPQASPSPVQTYATVDEARQVLIAFDIPENEVKDTLELLTEVGPNQLLHFSVKDIPQKTLWDRGFKL
jgi:hypothetical protein